MIESGDEVRFEYAPQEDGGPSYDIHYRILTGGVGKKGMQNRAGEWAGEREGISEPRRDDNEIPSIMRMVQGASLHSDEYIEKVRRLNNSRIEVLREIYNEMRYKESVDLKESEKKSERGVLDQLYLGDNGVVAGKVRGDKVVGEGFSCGVRFDLYECTSPDEKRRSKPHGLYEDKPPSMIFNKKKVFVKAVRDLSDEDKEIEIGEDEEDVPQDLKDEEKVVRWVWRKVRELAAVGNEDMGKQADYEYVKKSDLIRFFALNADIRESFHFGMYEYQRIINTMLTERTGYISYLEFQVVFF